MFLRVASILLFASAAPAAATDPTQIGRAAPIEDENGSNVPTAAPTGSAQTNSTNSATLDELVQLKAIEEARKATFDAAKAAAESKKAATEAQTAADVARVGTVAGQSTITGAVAMGNYGAKAEALLLVTRSAQLAAGEIATTLRPALDRDNARSVLILNGMSELATPDTIQFDLRVHGVTSAVQLAREYFAQAKIVDTPPIAADGTRTDQGQGGNRIAPIALAGTVLDGISKLGSYFLADYSFGNVEISTTSHLVANALVGALRRSSVTNSLIIPGNMVASDAGTLFQELDTVRALQISVLGEQGESRSRLEALATSTSLKGKRAAALYAQSDAAATRATVILDKLMTDLLADTPDGKEPLIVRVVRQKSIQEKLKSNPLILLLNSKEAAAYYTKKSLWTFLGGPPLYTMGGVSLTYTLYDNNGGSVVMAGTVGKHGGYRSVNSVEKLFR